MNKAASIGVIGGADGPTSIFISQMPLTTILMWGGIAAAVLLVLVLLFLHGRK